MDTLLKLAPMALDFSWLSMHYFLKGWDIFFKEEFGTIAFLHLIAVVFSTFFNCCSCLSQWQVSTLIILYRRIMAGGICTSKRRLDGKIAIVTGSNTGIGKETTRDLAKRGAIIVMACRDMVKANEVAQELKKETEANIVTMKMDLSSLDSVRSFVKEFKSKYEALHILINNAGIMMPAYGLTKDGFEQQFGVNHLGHFLLTNLLLPLMKEVSEARIINLTSTFHLAANIDLSDMLYKKGYNKRVAYANSKLANIQFSRMLADRLKNTNIKVFSVHPGVVQSELGRSLPLAISIIYQNVLRIFCKSTREGAQTTIHCSTEAETCPDTFYSDCVKGVPTKAARDHDAANKLWDLSERLVKLEKSLIF